MKRRGNSLAEALPKTRSGKIMRQLLRDVAAGKQTTQDTTPLEDLNVLIMPTPVRFKPRASLAEPPHPESGIMGADLIEIIRLVAVLAVMMVGADLPGGAAEEEKNREQ